VSSDCLFLASKKANEGVRGDRVNEDFEVGRDGTRAETSARGASVAETAGDDTEAMANMSTEASATNGAAAPVV
jgi:hypothetical protein